MFAIGIVKKRKSDLWLVTQTIPVKGDEMVNDKIIYKGHGRIKIVELIRKCHAEHSTLKPARRAVVDPSCRALGFTTRGSFNRWTHTMRIWQNDDAWGWIMGRIALGGEWCPIALELQITNIWRTMDDPNWPRQTWYAIRRTFEYAEQFKSGTGLDWRIPPDDY